MPFSKPHTLQQNREPAGEASETRPQAGWHPPRLRPVELQLEELEAAATEDEVAAPPPATGERSARRRPVRGPQPAHLPRERVVLPSPSACLCCGGRLS